MPLVNPNESVTFGSALSLRVDGAIGAMSLSPNGRDAVLAGRRGLFIIDLDDPFTTPRWLHHITSWEVADVQWSPHHNAKPSWCISTSNQKALLWDLSRPSNNAISNVLHRHTRAITDINFHPSDPEILATCSIDTFILSWDMRCPRLPVAQWAEWRAGATQVKWNHENPYEIASAHDNTFYLWDTRKGALPVVKVSNAHRGKINGLDFSSGSSGILTCSNDQTVKLWDLKSDSAIKFAESYNFFQSDTRDNNSNGINDSKIAPTVVIHTEFPVARARSIPFGTDNACGIMPLQGGSDAIHVVNYEAAYTEAIKTGKTVEFSGDAAYKFSGHEGSMKDFLWRTRHEQYKGFDTKNNKDFQLVTWSSQDYDLKLWPHDDNLYSAVNYNPSHQPIIDIFSESDSESVISSATVTTEATVVDSSKTTNPTQPTSIPSMESTNSITYNYDTFCTEPAVTIDDITKGDTKDPLSSLTMYQIVKRNKHHGYSQLNHLDWISGVRMGRSTPTAAHSNAESTSLDEESGPSNLGEEVSIVGHKFPKIRFEKISVSTGELIISLRGPITGNATNTSGLGANSGKATYPANSTTTSIIQEVDDNLDQAGGENENTLEERSLKVEILSNQSDIDDKSSIGGVLESDTNGSTKNTSNNAPGTPQIDESTEQILTFIRMEVKFPKVYPHLEELPDSSTTSAKQLLKLQKQNLIKFNIEETHELTSSIKQDMIDTLNNIAHFYANKHQRFCLEPCLRYLMGDKIDLTESLIMEDTTQEDDDFDDGEFIQEVGSEGWADDLINQQPGIHSSPIVSDNDEDFDDGFDLIPAIQDDEMKNSIDSLKKGYSMTNPSNSNLNENVLIESNGLSKNMIDSTPVPKGCGAVWSHTGQLVCFFIPKKDEDEEESKALQKFNIFKFTDGGFSLGQEHESHNQHHNHHHHHNHHNSKNLSIDSVGSDVDSVSSLDEDEDGDYSSDCGSNSGSSSESSSSDDSFTNDWDDILEDDIPSRSRIPGLFKTSVGLGNRYISRGTSGMRGISNRGSLNRFHSNGGTSHNKSSMHETLNEKSSKKGRKRKNKQSNKNIVGIFDMRHLIPDKYELACEYRVLGDSPEKLARYNGEIARKYGLKDISDVWRILEMVLVKDVEVNDINPVYYAPEGSNLMTAQNQSSGLMNQLFLNSEIAKQSFIDKNYRFYWGSHPFGHAWLVRSIFEYFERQKNIQMLAMLSCILFENANNIKKYTDGTVSVPIHTPYGAMPPPPTEVGLRHFNSISNTGQSQFSRPNSDEQSASFHDSFPGTFTDRNTNDFNNRFRVSSPSAQVPGYAWSIASSFDGSVKDLSPEKNLQLRKSIQGIQSVHATKFGSSDLLPFEGDQFPVSSGMQTQPKSKFIRRGTFQDSRRPVLNQRGIESTKRQLTSTKGINSTDLGTNKRGPPIVTIEMMNTASLDLYDDVYSQSLLGAQFEQKVKSYRDQYADMLYVWGLPISRIKILKFNYPDTEISHHFDGYESPFDVHQCALGSRNRSRLGNDVRLIAPITPPRALISPQAWNSPNKTGGLKFCNLCGLLVTKRLVVCTNCEHVLHSHCAVEWWTNDGVENSDECPSGCGCQCLLHRL
ncbi:maintenance of telomere capping protein 5 [[Candida] anglica]|uniref:Maintenance of telomere capping protein 5 n=1 Tax=[Candida] anglica TaxID=148631 RepID=A0ABP0EEQ4_9ASCO